MAAIAASTTLGDDALRSMDSQRAGHAVLSGLSVPDDADARAVAAAIADPHDMQRALKAIAAPLAPPGGAPLTPPRSSQRVLGATPSATRTRGLHSEGWFVPLPLDGADATLALGAAGVAGFFMFSGADRNIKRFSQSHKNDVTEALDRAFEPLGTQEGATAAAAGVYAIALVSREPELKDAALRAILAVKLAGIGTGFAKETAQRERPSGSDDPLAFHGPDGDTPHASFWSSHSATAAAMSHSLGLALRRDPRPHMRALAPFVEGAGFLTAWSRVHHNAHWTSDVVLGYTFGYLTAELVDRLGRGDRRGGFRVVPTMLDNGAAALNVAWEEPDRRPSTCAGLPETRAGVEACLDRAFNGRRSRLAP